ncbi:hypothetical protein [Saliterribacillus persicus]|uniref:DUF4367 domain-containing protein n=1 Tax=Saliterribacillus persicus TaxID=930114 RepID=A0A368X8G8_9BACI|nr:hypothetical protein [Saliterribacillus persicus]RCW64261.1 hypothetical protein DFR57_11448 [Saliterribacillus persicus]
MLKKGVLVTLIFLILSACSSNSSALETDNLIVEKDDININYEAVEKDIAAEAVPFKIKYPTYIPFDSEEAKVVITAWEKDKEKVVASLTYASTEEDAKWKKDSFVQPVIPHVRYTIANFDRYFSRYANKSEYREIEISNNTKGLIQYILESNGAALHWFHEGKEYNIVLRNFNNDKEKLKKELIKIADSI